MTARYALYRVQGESMAPSLRHGDYVLARSANSQARLPKRGDIVVLAAPEQTQLKRIVALPGDRLVFMDGMLLLNGERLVEAYLRGLPPYLGLDSADFALGENECFVMGDNRARSVDSRTYGPVNLSKIEGRAVRRIWPPRRWGSL